MECKSYPVEELERQWLENAKWHRSKWMWKDDRMEKLAGAEAWAAAKIPEDEAEAELFSRV